MADPSLNYQGVLNDPLIRSIFINRIYSTATYTILVWDWVATFKLEIEQIWKSRWSAAKICFLVQRYLSLIGLAIALALAVGNWKPESCKHIYSFPAWVAVFILGNCNLILFVRAYTIWDKPRWLLIVGVGCLAIDVGFMFLAASQTHMIPLPQGMQAFSCLATGKRASWNPVAGMWLTPLCFDVLMTALTSYRVLMYRRSGTSSDILTLFWRDGLVFFFLISTINALNGIYFLAASELWQSVNAYPSLCLASVLSQRLILHLRVHRSGTSSGVPSHTLTYSLTTGMNQGSLSRFPPQGDFESRIGIGIDSPSKMATPSPVLQSPRDFPSRTILKDQSVPSSRLTTPQMTDESYPSYSTRTHLEIAQQAQHLQ